MSFVDNIHLPRPAGGALPAAGLGAANAGNFFPRKESQMAAGLSVLSWEGQQLEAPVSPGCKLPIEFHPSL